MSSNNEGVNDNNIVIEIDGENFGEFISGSVSRRFDEFCGTFNFKCTKDTAGDFNIDENSKCNIYVNGHKVITGVIDKVAPSDDSDSSEVDISGRDVTCDLVDSSLPQSINLSGDFDLPTVITKVLEAFELQNDIKVINEIKNLRPFTKADIISAEVDKNAFDFMNEYAQKVSAVLLTDADGNIIITRAGESGTKTVIDKILNQVGNPDNNVLSSSASYDYSNRFYKYIVVSQGNANTAQKEISLDSVSQKGIAYDEEVRKSRVLVIKSDKASNSATCGEIATLEANTRRANSLNYSCEVAGYQLNNGDLYSINTLMQVLDDDNFIDSELMIKSVTFNFGDGSTTNLEFAVKDAYTMQANLDEIDARANKTGKNKKEKTKKKKDKGKKTKKSKNTQLTPEQQKEFDRILGL